MKQFLIIIGLISVFSARSANITHTVTKVDYFNGTGSFGEILTLAIAQVANGHNVTINLNAPGLIKTDAGFTNGWYAYFFNITGSGTLLIQKDPSLPVSNKQGFIKHVYPLGSGYGGSLWLIDNSSNGLTFSNLYFKDFNYVMWTLNGNCQFMEVSDCTFENNSASIIMWDYDSNNLITRNTCIDTDPNNTMSYFALIAIPVTGRTCQVNVTDNYVDLPNAGYGIIYETQGTSGSLPVTSSDVLSSNCYSNTIKNTNAGLCWRTQVVNRTYNYNNFNVSMKYNKIYNSEIGFLNWNPLKSLVFDQNTFQNNGVDFYVADLEINTPLGANNYGFDLIANNTLGLTPKNANNIFLGSNKNPYFSFIANQYLPSSISNAYGSGVNLVGLQLPGRVKVEYNYNVNIQENLINTDVPNIPIELAYSGNKMIAAPTINSASFATATQINVSYILNGNQHISANSNFDVEFFKANSNGDLKVFLGRQTINTANLNLNQNYVINLPLGVTFNAGDKLAATVTSKGNIGGTQVGTSMISYPALCSVTAFMPTSTCLNAGTPFNGVALCGNVTSQIWSFGDGSVSNANPATHNYVNPGTYQVTLSTLFNGQTTPVVTTQSITISNCEPPQPCINCIGSFAPDPGEYVLHAWVREDVSPQPITYTRPKVEVTFTGNPAMYLFGTNATKNKVIEGWQRIEEVFTIPTGATHLNLNLKNTGGNGAPDVFFDDIRIFPKDGQMKTYVYDPLTMRLSAVLDENNYATFYEYDEEGKLIRVKKETEKGVMTIQESRESMKKKN
jgi:hypothetical protein